MAAMSDKTVVVTGATSGIGKATATDLARRGADVVMICRNESKAKSTQDEITRQVPGSEISYVLADMANLEQVREAAAEINRVNDRVDVLVNNAGVHMFDREYSDDGYEMTIAVNHLAPFLLTNLLLDKLTSSAPARVVTVASEAHRFGHRIDFDDLMSEKRNAGFVWSFKTYGRSKLMNRLFAEELARRHDPEVLTSNSLCPGLVATNLTGESPLARRIVETGLKLRIANSPENGARMSVRLATDPGLAGVTGQFFSSAPGTSVLRAMPTHLGAADAARLWDVSAELVGLA